MSKVVLTTLQGTSESNYMVSVVSGNTFKYPGTVVQTKYVRSDTRTTYTSPASGNGTTITDLNLTIVPKFSNSLILLTWMINGEIAENNVFLVHQDGSLITTTGYEAYNNVVGNVYYSGLISGRYDADLASTPQNYNLQYYVPAGSTSSRTYAPAVRSASTGAQTFYLNRTANSTGTDGYEVGISVGIAMEIAQ